MKYPHRLLWMDLETSGLDPATLHVLEVAVIITDFDLNPEAGYTEVIKMTRGALEQIRADEIVLDMHKANGLIKASVASEFTLPQVEQAVINLLKQETAFDEGEFILAGSGVASFDLQVVRAQMPTLARWLTYYCLDTGNLRRSAKILSGGRDLINPHTPSFADGAKAHRALPDVEAHIEEARRYQAFFRQATAV